MANDQSDATTPPKIVRDTDTSRRAFLAKLAMGFGLLVAYGALAVQGLRRKRVWQRFLGVAAVAAALYMIAMAFLYFTALRTIIMPEF